MSSETFFIAASGLVLIPSVLFGAGLVTVALYARLVGRK